MDKITILDYGVGNIASLRNAFAALKIPVELTANHKLIEQAAKLILPGVGAFAPAMIKLKEKKLDKLIISKANEGTPLLGICLGMQLLFTRSFEQGEWQGLDLISGSVEKFEKVDKIPHMGWNLLKNTNNFFLLKNLQPEPYFYFVHSYFCTPENKDQSIGECEYGGPFCAAVQKENIFGVQFHPEKSQKDGLQILMNFAEIN